MTMTFRSIEKDANGLITGFEGYGKYGKKYVSFSIALESEQLHEGFMSYKDAHTVGFYKYVPSNDRHPTAYDYTLINKIIAKITNK